jgi:hypothetical protein
MEETNNTETEDLEYLDDNKLFRIAYWSKAASWVILAIGILNLVFVIGRNYFSDVYRMAFWGAPLLELIAFFTAEIFRLISAAISFFLLQAVGEILYLMIDIREQMETREA